MLIEDAILKNIEKTKHFYLKKKIQEQDCSPTKTCIVLAFVILLYVYVTPPPFFFTHMLMYTCIVMLYTCIIRPLTLLFIASIQFVPHSAILYIYTCTWVTGLSEYGHELN